MKWRKGRQHKRRKKYEQRKSEKRSNKKRVWKIEKDENIQTVRWQWHVHAGMRESYCLIYDRTKANRIEKLMTTDRTQKQSKKRNEQNNKGQWKENQEDKKPKDEKKKEASEKNSKKMKETSRCIRPNLLSVFFDCLLSMQFSAFCFVLCTCFIRVFLLVCSFLFFQWS